MLFFRFMTEMNQMINYLKYIITPKGISIRTKLTISFMKRTMQEYDQLKEELGNINKDQDVDHS